MADAKEAPRPTSGCPLSEQAYHQAVLRHLDEKFESTIQNCPGCLYNCYMMEESLGVTGNSIEEKALNLFFTILEIPTLIQMARVKANRSESTTIFTDKDSDADL